MLWRNGVIHFIIAQEVVGGLNEKKLQHAFDDDLLEDTSPISEGNLAPGLWVLGC